MITSLPPFMPWPTPSIRLWATSARRLFTLIRWTQIRSIRPTRSKIWSPTCAAAKVDVLVILGGNPAYDAPADLGFADA